MKPSRRAFLFGRKAASDPPWQQFCQQLQRSCLGQVVNLGDGTARLAPVNTNDVQHAYRLCEQYDVQLALAGTSNTTTTQPVLWLDPASALTRLEPDTDVSGLWHAQAGVRLADLQSAGLTQVTNAPADMTLAAWLAGAASDLCATGCTQDAGVISLDVLLADGTRATLGAFGEHASEPLRGVVMQRLVPQLFELAHSDDAETCLAQPRWPAQLRLDALRGSDVNLAHLLLGHGGTLAWVHAAVLTAAPLQSDTTAPTALPPAITQAAARINAVAKLLFDPSSRWQQAANQHGITR